MERLLLPGTRPELQLTPRGFTKFGGWNKVIRKTERL